MQDSGQLLGYLQQGIDALLEQESFDGGQEFRRTQKQALEAYQRYLSNENFTTEEKLKGFFEIPTGVGKTAVFVGIVAAAHKVAQEAGEELKTAIIVPTIQLLGQTEEAFKGNDLEPDDEDYFNGFAPWLNDQIGLYGDGKKNLDNPITIMTYDAWVALTEAGALSSQNIDILISDEAHRGTSERRVENISGSFNENTIQIAFTATAHFDEDKSVQNSHEREIFYKKPADAIREGELAAYVSSQRFIIRVDPDDYMLSDEFQDASQERRAAYRRAAKQNAWNKRMVTIFREGRDEKTGDLLTDNQAGFFVEGVKQADRLEDLLNSDPELIRRAEGQGYEGVAVAIHSGLSKGAIKERYEGYKAGKYLAVIGDEMFKEGFDHPPMKTLFDCPHSSVVDKAQILGRGLRKWWNKLKGRFEGLTVIDTVVYFADEDEDKEDNNRERALMDTVSVKQVLEGSHIDGPDVPIRPSAGGASGGGGGSLFDDDPDVEEYTTTAGVYELEQEVDSLNEAERLRQETLWKNNPLTIADIKETIEAYQEANGRKNPSAVSGDIEHGPLAERITWGGLNQAIFNGVKGSGYGNGLSDDPEYQIYLDSLDVHEIPSLSNVLAYFGFANKKLILTMADIKSTIEAYRKKNYGENPTKTISDKMTSEALGGQFDWIQINGAISSAAKGPGRGFNLADDPEYQIYLDSLDVNEAPSLLNILPYFGFADKKRMLTMADIKSTVAGFRAEKDGENPMVRSGEITNGALAGQFKWGGLQSAIANAAQGPGYGNGLADDPEYQTYFNSLDLDEKPGLASILAYFGFADKKITLTMANIKAAIEAYREENNGKIPKVTSGDIASGVLAGKFKWGGLQSALQNAIKGTGYGYNLAEDPEYKTYLDSLDTNEKPGLVSVLVHFGFTNKNFTLTMANIKVAIEAYRKANDGKNPDLESGDITVKPFAGQIKWNTLHSLITKIEKEPNSSKGLSDDSEYKTYTDSLDVNEKAGLTSLLVYFGFANKKLTLTVADIKATIKSYREENDGKNPSASYGDIVHGPLAGKITWGALSQSIVLAQKGRGNGLSKDPKYQEWLEAEAKPSLAKLCKKIDNDEKQQQARLQGPNLNAGP
jgi:superfamily II DNA or RNA helicase